MTVQPTAPLKFFNNGCSDLYVTQKSNSIYFRLWRSVGPRNCLYIYNIKWVIPVTTLFSKSSTHVELCGAYLSGPAMAQRP
ncbi:hypothetical protein GDO81_016090 [Engystomops pustulosus]|uniref:Uncharacterized protein n=1 Tax=Engystomops pustulosus TaxID=76066 RepID=A0AAV7API3_ENGPU|nr:hypothetical protein GDO81_016090 [Engystomops pustulosus]